MRLDTYTFVTVAILIVIIRKVEAVDEKGVSVIVTIKLINDYLTKIRKNMRKES